MLNIICTIEQITPIFCVFLSIIVSSTNSDLSGCFIICIDGKADKLFQLFCIIQYFCDTCKVLKDAEAAFVYFRGNVCIISELSVSHWQNQRSLFHQHLGKKGGATRQLYNFKKSCYNSVL